MPKFRTVFLVVALWIVGVWPVEAVPQTADNSDAASPPADAPSIPPEDSAFDTRNDFEMTAAGRSLPYVAETGRLTVPPGDSDVPRGHMFFVSYREVSRPAPDARRPVTFVFNGGPGAAAAYLHLGLMGPRRVTFADDGRVTSDPRVVENTETWLRFTDLVFVDPVGTGFSRAAEGAHGDGDAKKDGKARPNAPGSHFWATEKDLDTLGAFIRLYLTRNGRWLSPVVLAGESYGGFRVAALAERLHERFGVSPRGLVMVSPALELGLLTDSRFRTVPWVLRLPSYAAAQRRHAAGSEPAGKSNGPSPLRDVEAFARTRFLPHLFAGPKETSGADSVLRQVADYTGLADDLVMRYGGKIPMDVFATELLQRRGSILSVYDASISFPAPHPAQGYYQDPRLARISAAIATAFNHYVRGDLGVRTDLPYEVLNREVSPQWKWQEGRGRAGPPGSAENLESALKTVPGLRALLVHGIYDLVTPYFASQYVVNQLDLTPELRRRLLLRNYEGGHMFYSHAASRKAFFEDARVFYENGWSDGGQSAIP